MKSYKLILLLSVLLAISCSNEDDTFFKQEPAERIALQVSGNIASRATGNVWEQDDSIGIFMLRNSKQLALENIAEGAFNNCYVYRDGFTPMTDNDTVWFPRDPETKVDFIAYYPYSEIDNPILPVDRQTDVLYADRISGRDKSEPNVSFNFRHIMSRIEVELIAGKGTNSKDLRNATVTLDKQPESGYCDLSDGSVTAEEVLATISLNGATIIFPSEGMEGRTLTFTLPELGKVLTWEIPSNKEFKAGESTTFHVTVKKKGEVIPPEPEPDPTPDPGPGPNPDPEIELSVTDSTVTDWIPGNGEDGEQGNLEWPIE